MTLQETETIRSVLLVGDFLSKSIANRGVCEDLAIRLAEAGWNVTTTSERLNRYARILDMLTTTWLRRREFGVAQVDVFSGRAFFLAESVCWVLRLAGKPYVLSLHGGNLPAFGKKWPVRVSRLLRSARVVTAPSRYFLEHMKSYRADMLVVPNPLDLTAHEFRIRAKPRPRLIWLRAFHEIYNPSLALESVARLAAKLPDSRLIMIGPDKKDGSLQRAKAIEARLGVAERVSFVGGIPRSEVPRWLGKGDIFVNTAHVDNAPVSVLEAMACGLCVVSTNVGGIPFLLEHEQDALLVPSDDPEEMARAVQRLVEEPGLARSLSVRGRRKVEGCDWSVVLPSWEAILTSAARGSARGQ